MCFAHFRKLPCRQYAIKWWSAAPQGLVDVKYIGLSGKLGSFMEEKGIGVPWLGDTWLAKEVLELQMVGG